MGEVRNRTDGEQKEIAARLTLHWLAHKVAKIFYLSQYANCFPSLLARMNSGDFVVPTIAAYCQTEPADWFKISFGEDINNFADLCVACPRFAEVCAQADQLTEVINSILARAKEHIQHNHEALATGQVLPELQNALGELQKQFYLIKYNPDTWELDFSHLKESELWKEAAVEQERRENGGLR